MQYQLSKKQIGFITVGQYIGLGAGVVGAIWLGSETLPQLMNVETVGILKKVGSQICWTTLIGIPTAYVTEFIGGLAGLATEGINNKISNKCKNKKSNTIEGHLL